MVDYPTTYLTTSKDGSPVYTFTPQILRIPIPKSFTFFPANFSKAVLSAGRSPSYRISTLASLAYNKFLLFDFNLSTTPTSEHRPLFILSSHLYMDEYKPVSLSVNVSKSFLVRLATLFGSPTEGGFPFFGAMLPRRRNCVLRQFSSNQFQLWIPLAELPEVSSRKELANAD